MDSDKVIKGLECCIEGGRCKDCPYPCYCEYADAWPTQLLTDVLALLKEQEAVEPKVEKSILDYQSCHYICGDCGGQIDINDNYCRHCGRTVAHLSNKI